MPQGPHDNETPSGDKRAGVNAFYGFSRVHCASFWPFIRNGQGTHSFAVIGPLAFLLMLVFGATTESPALLFGYEPCWLVMVVVRRLQADRREFSGYVGFPYLTAKLPFFRTERAAKSIEPLLLLAIGWLVYQFSQPLGLYIGLGCITSAFVTVAEYSALAVRARHVRDQEIQMQSLSREVRMGR